MDQLPDLDDVKRVAAEIDAEMRALPVRNTPGERAVRRKYSQRLKRAQPEFVLDLARELVETYGYRGFPYELIQNHRAAFRSVGEATLEELAGHQQLVVRRLLRAHPGGTGLAQRTGVRPVDSPVGALTRPLVATGGAGQHGGAECAVSGGHGRRSPHSGGVPPAGGRSRRHGRQGHVLGLA